MNYNISNADIRGKVINRCKEILDITLKKNCECSISTIDNNQYILSLTKKGKEVFKREGSVVDWKFEDLNKNLIELKSFIDDNYLLEYWIERDTPTKKMGKEWCYYSYDKKRATKQLLKDYEEIQNFFEENSTISGEKFYFFEFFGNKLRIIYDDDQKTGFYYFDKINEDSLIILTERLSKEIEGI